MDKEMLDRFDVRELEKVKKIIVGIYNYHYGTPNSKGLTDRLETIEKKIDELIGNYYER